MEARLEMLLLQWGCMTYASSSIWPIAPWEWEGTHSIPVSWGRDAWVVIFDQGSRLMDFSTRMLGCIAHIGWVLPILYPSYASSQTSCFDK